MPETENEDEGERKLKPASENFWYQLATLGGISKYWDAYTTSPYNEGADWTNAAVLETLLPSLDETQREKLFNLVSDFTRKDGIDYQKSDREIDFSNTEFFEPVYLTGFTFLQNVTFEGAVFHNTVNLNGATFEKKADFNYTHFMKEVSFEETEFFDSVYFLAAISRTTIKFISTKFKKFPPGFFDAKMSDAIIWRDVTWPEIGNNLSETDLGYHVDAYERLALMMSKLEKSHERHMFFRLEMRARRELDSNWAAKAMNRFYDSLSKYGYGFERALKIWFGHIIVGMLAIFPYGQTSLAMPTLGNIWTGIKLWGITFATSLSNAHTFLGLHRGPLKSVYEGYGQSEVFNVIWTGQAVFGVIFLFFLLLTLRNRFKMG